MKRAQFFEGTWGHGPTKIPTAKHFGRYFILPVPNSVSGTCLCNILRHKVSQHNFHNIHLLNVDSKFRDTEYEVRSPQGVPMYFYRPNNFGTKMTEMIRLYIYSIEISHTYGRSRL